MLGPTVTVWEQPDRKSCRTKHIASMDQLLALSVKAVFCSSVSHIMWLSMVVLQHEACHAIAQLLHLHRGQRLALCHGCTLEACAWLCS